jgi:hypothetical protein
VLVPQDVADPFASGGGIQAKNRLPRSAWDLPTSGCGSRCGSRAAPEPNAALISKLSKTFRAFAA